MLKKKEAKGGRNENGRDSKNDTTGNMNLNIAEPARSDDMDFISSMAPESPIRAVLPKNLG